jgi:hypothetical protein
VISLTVKRSEQEYFWRNHQRRREFTGAVYSVFKQLGKGEFLFVASRDELEQAVQLIEALNAHWPGEYLVRDSGDNDVSLTQ